MKWCMVGMGRVRWVGLGWGWVRWAGLEEGRGGWSGEPFYNLIHVLEVRNLLQGAEDVKWIYLFLWAGRGGVGWGEVVWSGLVWSSLVNCSMISPMLLNFIIHVLHGALIYLLQGKMDQ